MKKVIIKKKKALLKSGPKVVGRDLKNMQNGKENSHLLPHASHFLSKRVKPVITRASKSDAKLAKGVAGKLIIKPKPVSKVPTIPQHQLDAKNMTATELRKKYQLTYNSWRNMKGRRKYGAKVAPEFMEFRSFLHHMGPRPRGDYTPDRLDNNNPLYAPKLCYWRNKRDQANNRRNTRYVTHKGECLPLTVWADRTDQNADTLRNRKRLGWSDDQVILGKSAPQIQIEKDCFPNIWPGDLEERIKWEKIYRYSHRNSDHPPMTRHEYLISRVFRKIVVGGMLFEPPNDGDFDAFGEPRTKEYYDKKKEYLELRAFYDMCVAREKQYVEEMKAKAAMEAAKRIEAEIKLRPSPPKYW